jgi:hypothetical protein
MALGRSYIEAERARAVNRRRICTFVALSAIAACSYGPPERYRDFDEFITAPDSSVTAYLRGFNALRLPRGLAAFPDGGIPQKASSGAEVFLCERGKDSFRLIARVTVPAPMQDRGQYHLKGWIGELLVLQLTGDSTALVRIHRTGAADTAGSVYATRPIAPGLSGVALPECRRALDSLSHSDPVLNYTM